MIINYPQKYIIQKLQSIMVYDDYPVKNLQYYIFLPLKHKYMNN